jgi:hypothetical protein
MHAAILAGTCALMAAACEPAPERRAERPATTPAGEPGVQRRPPSRSARVVVTANGPARDLVRRSVADLRRLHYWRSLTSHLDEIALSTRSGTASIPEDGHLADAFLTVTGNASGALCDIRFYPAAIARDLRRQARFYSAGQLAERPPNLRQFWVSILAHELAHCLPHENFFRQRGEPIARAWEHRALERARERLE